MEERKKYIDILKVIGLLCIILAHVKPPNNVFQIRTFDVTLMILVSAYLGLSSTKKENYLSYVFKRFIRLVIPTWIFLTFIFFIGPKINILPISNQILKHTYLLDYYYTIGYVWVIRIYLIVALLVPICKYFINNNKTKLMLGLTLILYIIYEVLCHYNILIGEKVEYFISYFIPCLLLIVIAYYYFKADNKKLIIYTLLSTILCVALGFYYYKRLGHFVTPNDLKYPFRIYYLNYGILITGILLLILKQKIISDILSNRVVIFISKHSLWIYLWHIFVMYYTEQYNLNWAPRFFIVVICSILITFIQSLVIKLLEKIKIPKWFLNIFNG